MDFEEIKVTKQNYQTSLNTIKKVSARNKKVYLQIKPEGFSQTDSDPLSLDLCFPGDKPLLFRFTLGTNTLVEDNNQVELNPDLYYEDDTLDLTASIPIRDEESIVSVQTELTRLFKDGTFYDKIMNFSYNYDVKRRIENKETIASIDAKLDQIYSFLGSEEEHCKIEISREEFDFFHHFKLNRNEKVKNRFICEVKSLPLNPYFLRIKANLGEETKIPFSVKEAKFVKQAVAMVELLYSQVELTILHDSVFIRGEPEERETPSIEQCVRYFDLFDWRISLEILKEGVVESETLNYSQLTAVGDKFIDRLVGREYSIGDQIKNYNLRVETNSTFKKDIQAVYQAKKTNVPRIIKEEDIFTEILEFKKNEFRQVEQGILPFLVDLPPIDCWNTEDTSVFFSELKLKKEISSSLEKMKLNLGEENSYHKIADQLEKSKFIDILALTLVFD